MIEARPFPRNDATGVVRNLFFDLRRATLFVWTCLKLAVACLVAPLTGGDRPEVLLRKSLQKLGLTYLKLGQFLALRADLLPQSVCLELGKLFEQVVRMPPDEVRFVIESELGGPLERLFSEFRWEPLASASVAQVHEAITVDGERVAVKVQRANLTAYLRADMRNLRRAAALIDSLHVLGALSVSEVANEFATYTWRELDFLMEGRTAERLRSTAVSGEIIPRVFWPLTTQRVLTLEFIEGVSLARAYPLVLSGHTDELVRMLPGLDLCACMRNLATASLHQLLIVGFFHADPHPGNIFLCKGNRIALVDFGIFGAVTAEQRELLTGHIEQIAQGNVDESFRYYSRLFTPTERTDYPSFQRESKAVLSRWLQASSNPAIAPGDRMVAKFSDEMFAVVRRHHLTMGVDTLLFWRGLIVLDATVLQLCPSFDLLKELRHFFEEFRPGILDRLWQLGEDSGHAAAALLLGSKLPTHVEEILSRLSTGRFRSNIMLEESPQVRQRENRRLEALALVLVGLSLALLTKGIAGPARPIVWGLTLVLFLLSIVRLR